MEDDSPNILEYGNEPKIESIKQSSSDSEEESVDLSLWKPKSDEVSDKDDNDSGLEVDAEPINPSEVVISTFDISDSRKVLGLSLLGRSHQKNGTVCQDYHVFKDLGDGWQVYLVSDGAGSASQAHRGAKMNCELGLFLTSQLIEKSNWKNREDFPTNTEWALEFDNLCHAIKQMTKEKIESLDEPVKPKDFNATFMLMIVSPKGLLCGHIGDGRMGYKDFDGQWHSIIIPHKGDEPNQTVFMMNEWDRIRTPKLRMSGIYIPDSIVVHCSPIAVVMITDGCENSSWNCTQFDPDIEKYVDVNTPFEPFWDSLIEMLSDDKSYYHMVKYVDSSSEPCILEEDDRTLLLGVYNNSEKSNENETAIHIV